MEAIKKKSIVAMVEMGEVNEQNTWSCQDSDTTLMLSV